MSDQHGPFQQPFGGSWTETLAWTESDTNDRWARFESMGVLALGCLGVSDEV